MSSVKAPLSLRLKNNFSGVWQVLKKPRYALLALISGFIFSGIISTLLKFDIVQLFLFELDLPLSERIIVMRDLFTDIYVSYPLREAFGTLLLSYLFGFVFSVMVFIVRNRAKEKLPGKSSGLGVMFGAISGGCAACGTSILAPLLSTFGITTTASALRFAFFVNLIGACIMLYSLYSLGGVAKTIQQKQLTNV